MWWQRLQTIGSVSTIIRISITGSRIRISLSLRLQKQTTSRPGGPVDFDFENFTREWFCPFPTGENHSIMTKCDYDRRSWKFMTGDPCWHNFLSTKSRWDIVFTRVEASGAISRDMKWNARTIDSLKRDPSVLEFLFLRPFSFRTITLGVTKMILQP